MALSLIAHDSQIITHIIGASTTITFGAGSYGAWPILVVAAAGTSSRPFDFPKHYIEVIADSITYSKSFGPGTGFGNDHASSVDQFDPSLGPEFNPPTFDNGFTLRLRSPEATLDGVFGYMLIRTTSDDPTRINGYYLADPPTDPGTAIPWLDGSGTITLPLPGVFEYDVDQMATQTVGQGAWAVQTACGFSYDGSPPPTWGSGWSNPEQLQNGLKGMLAMGFYGTADVNPIPWSLNPPGIPGSTDFGLYGMNEIFFNVVVARGRSYAQVIG